jgi:hypothetical protein
MDLDGVGVFGISWGGYHTLRAMVQAPETFHVGVADARVADLDDHMARAIEPYMGLPAENREAYDYASILLLTNRLEGTARGPQPAQFRESALAALVCRPQTGPYISQALDRSREGKEERTVGRIAHTARSRSLLSTRFCAA